MPRKLQPILARSNRWGRIKTFPIARFRDLLGVPPGAYERGNDFVRFVIQPALLGVNGLSTVGVDVSLVRRSRVAPIEAVTAAWWPKQGDEFRAVLCERERPKLGRIARLRGGGRDSLSAA